MGWSLQGRQGRQCSQGRGLQLRRRQGNGRKWETGKRSRFTLEAGKEKIMEKRAHSIRAPGLTLLSLPLTFRTMARRAKHWPCCSSLSRSKSFGLVSLQRKAEQKAMARWPRITGSTGRGEGCSVGKQRMTAARIPRHVSAACSCLARCRRLCIIDSSTTQSYGSSIS